MIGKLKGILDIVEEDHLILDVAGVGYIIYVSAKSMMKLPDLGATTALLTYMQVKEDDISLYGFMEKSEKKWFENLITVQGIGPRLALTILSNLDPDMLVSAIVERNKEIFKHISGVGPKLAERIFTELSKKANQDFSGVLIMQPVIEENDSNIKDALIALTNLGYNRNEVQAVCKAICQNKPDVTINELIRLALKELSS